jgi:hypothetical protein
MENPAAHKKRIASSFSSAVLRELIAALLI